MSKHAQHHVARCWCGKRCFIWRILDNTRGRKLSNLETRIRQGGFVDKVMPVTADSHSALYLSSFDILSLIPSFFPQWQLSAYHCEMLFSYHCGAAMELLLMVWTVWKCLPSAYIIWQTHKWTCIENSHRSLNPHGKNVRLTYDSKLCACTTISVAFSGLCRWFL